MGKKMVTTSFRVLVCMLIPGQYLQKLGWVHFYSLWSPNASLPASFVSFCHSKWKKISNMTAMGSKNERTKVVLMFCVGV